MSANNNKNLKPKPVQPRYIVINEDIFHALDIYETRVYQALRYKADYRSECSDVEMTINQLIEISKVKRSTLFYCLDSLENKHFLIRRINWEKGTFGKANEYEVAQHLYHFKPLSPVEDEENEHEKNDENVHSEGSALNNNENINGSYIEGVHTVDGVVQHMDGGMHTMHSVAQKAQTKNAFEIFWNAYPKKKNKKRAKQIWYAAKLDKKFHEIMEKLTIQCAHDADWKKGFAPHASTYLNGERWEDEIAKDISNNTSAAPKISTPVAPPVVYSQFVGEIKLLKQIKQIPDETQIPSFAEWQAKDIGADAKIYLRSLGL